MALKDVNALVKRAAGIALAAMLLGGSAAAQTSGAVWDKIVETGQLHCGALPDYKPHSWKVTGSADYDGFVIEYCRAVARDLSAELGKTIEPQFVETSWATIVLDIQSGRIDFGVGLSPTEERLKAIDMPGPAYALADVILYRKGHEMLGNKWEDYNKPEIRVAAVSGTAQVETGLEMLPNAEHLQFKGKPEMILALQSGRADINISAFFGGLAALQEGEAVYEGLIVPEPRLDRPSHFGTRRDGDGRFTAWLQEWADKVRTNGEAYELMEESLVKAGLDTTALDGFKR